MKNVFVLMAMFSLVFSSGCGTPEFGVDRGQGAWIREDGRPPVWYQNGQLYPQQPQVQAVPVPVQQPVVVQQPPPQPVVVQQMPVPQQVPVVNSPPVQPVVVTQAPEMVEVIYECRCGNTYTMSVLVGTEALMRVKCSCGKMMLYQSTTLPPRSKPRSHLPRVTNGAVGMSATFQPDPVRKSETHFSWNFNGMPRIQYDHEQGTRNSVYYESTPWREVVNPHQESYSRTHLSVEPAEERYVAPMSSRGISLYDYLPNLRSGENRVDHYHPPY